MRYDYKDKQRMRLKSEKKKNMCHENEERATMNKSESLNNELDGSWQRWWKF